MNIREWTTSSQDCPCLCARLRPTGNSSTSTMKYPVVVIGAGFSGVTSVKACLEEHLDVVCFEKTDAIGGLWRYRDEDVEGIASVMKSTIIDTSKEMEAFSDFPPPTEFANYMHNTKVLEYLELYAKQFQIYPHIRFNHQVTSISQCDDFEKTGEWWVRTKDLKTGKENEMLASAIMVAIGHHVYPHMPKFEGQSDFKGSIIHSHSYKDFHGFEGKNALVVGMGNSAMDVAVELSRVSPKVYMSTRRGAWIAPRVSLNGIPLDLMVNSRIVNYFISLLPKSTVDSYLIKQLDLRFDHAKFNVRPKHGPRDQHTTVSDELPSRILAGAVTIKGDIHHFSPTGVFFQGEENTEYPVDAVVMATGYDYKLPFVPESIVAMYENRAKLYKFVFPIDLKPHTMAVIGFVQPQGAVFPMSEIQARWAVQVFQKKLTLPSVDDMENDLAREEVNIERRFPNTQRHTIEVDHVPYMDTVAKKLGVKPNLWKLAVTDPKLWWKCFNGPCVSYQYRLEGPHSKRTESREAIMTVWHRVFGALDTRKPKVHFEKERGSFLLFLFYMFCVWFLAFYIF